jgi:chorismate mutase/prephenate dehydratase
MDNPIIDSLYHEIDAVDTQLVQLLNQRAEKAVAVGRLKNTTGQKIYDPVRENVVFDHIGELNGGPLPKGSLEEIYRTILSASREIQIQG